jgi:short-subunit dehydrogenase
MAYALITGGSKGIGKAIAEELASAGFDILLVARSTDLLQETMKGIKARFGVQCDHLTADLTDPGSVRYILDWCNKNGYGIAVLVNNAGFGICGPFEKSGPEEQQDMMQVNMVIPVLLCQAFIPLLRKQGKAYILNIGSTTAYHAVPLMSLYAASKAFMLRFSRGLHEELRKTGISVTCVCPGTTGTDFPERAKVPARAIKNGKKIEMSARDVAKKAVRGMLAGKKEVVPGFINKLTVFLVWLLPHKLAERTALNIYRG